MTLDQLRIFVEVAERQHLTQAAAALFLTPSAVSAAIKALEDRYDLALFHRVGRRIELSDAGRIFLDEARRTLASVRTAEATLAELGGLGRGALTLHASQTISSYWLPPLLVRFRQAYPAIELRMEIGNTEQVSQAVLLGTADLGFVEGAIDDSLLAVEAVGEDKMVVVVAPGHPWADGRRLQADDLLKAQWILREAGSGTRSVFKSALDALGIAPGGLQVALELPSNEAVRSAVMAGSFATAMSELVVTAPVRAGMLALANVELPTRHFAMLRHPARHRSRAVAAFEELARAYAAPAG
ncbi:MAG TPA: LysR substrate-binding domain-containing protein [Telluria sp.]